MRMTDNQRAQLMIQRKQAWEKMIASHPSSEKRKELKAEYTRLLELTS